MNKSTFYFVLIVLIVDIVCKVDIRKKINMELNRKATKN